MQTTSILDKTAAGVERLSNSAQDAAARAAEIATSTAETLSEKGAEFVETSQRLSEASRDYVRRHPFAAVGLAVGVGVLLGFLRKRPH